MELEAPSVQDMGKVEKGGIVVIFLVLSWPGLMTLRDAFGLKSDCFQPHVIVVYSEDIWSWWEARRWEWPFLDKLA